MLRLTAIAATALLLTGCGRPLRGNATLRNGTSERVDKVHIGVAGQNFDFANIAPGRGVQAEFTVRGESYYDVSAPLHAGRVVTARVGYVDPAYSVTADHLELTATSVVEDTLGSSASVASLTP